jgi:hypothetical protein
LILSCFGARKGLDFGSDRDVGRVIFHDLHELEMVRCMVVFSEGIVILFTKKSSSLILSCCFAECAESFRLSVS